MIEAEALARCWNELYGDGRYLQEPPLRFTARILATLREHPDCLAGHGLYLGCGNGRNYGPLLRAGLDLDGVDISAVALEQLARRLPEAAPRLRCADLRGLTAPPGGFDYLVAIQVLQHGDQAEVEGHFRKVAELLRPGGLFFLRVNSTAAEIFFEHRELDRNEQGGFSVECLEGAKRGQAVHFYSADELRALAHGRFEWLGTPEECHEVRPPPRRGRWAQWEAILRRA